MIRAHMKKMQATAEKQYMIDAGIGGLTSNPLLQKQSELSPLHMHNVAHLNNMDHVNENASEDTTAICTLTCTHSSYTVIELGGECFEYSGNFTFSASLSTTSEVWAQWKVNNPKINRKGFLLHELLNREHSVAYLMKSFFVLGFKCSLFSCVKSWPNNRRHLVLTKDTSLWSLIETPTKRDFRHLRQNARGGYLDQCLARPSVPL